MKKITEITTEREFISKLRTYYRRARRKGYQRNEISFLGLMEYIGSATREFEYQSEKYFSVGIRAYQWHQGNSLLSALIDKWEDEIEAEKRKKQIITLAETPRIVRVEIVRDFDSTYYANLYDESGNSHSLSKEYVDYRTLKSLCKSEYGVTIPNLANVEFEKHGRKSYAHISTETPRISTETAEVENAAGESVKAPETHECRVCSHCGKHFHEGYFLGDEYACGEECAIALYGGDREQFEEDLQTEEQEPGTTECYWSVWQ